VYLPKYLFPAIVLVINTIKFAVIFGLLLVFLLLYGFSPSEAWLSLPLLVLVQFLLIAMIAGLVSAFVPFVPDFRFLLDNLLMLLFFLSGIFFDISKASGELKFVLSLNPMAVIIDSYRAVLIEGQWPNGLYLGGVFVISILGIWLTNRVFRHYDRIYPKVLV